LVSLKLPTSLTRIEAYTFQFCSSLASIDFPTNVEYIGRRAFMDCASLVSIDFPASLQTTGSDVFMDCTSLRAVTLTATHWSYQQAAFRGCSSLISVCGATNPLIQHLGTQLEWDVAGAADPANLATTAILPCGASATPSPSATCSVTCGVTNGNHVKVTHDTTSQHSHHRCNFNDPGAVTLVCQCKCCSDSGGTDCSDAANYVD
jgi:hypothetical protein